MNKPDQVRLTYDQNPSLAEAIKGKKNGDKLKWEMHSTLKASDAEGVDLTIEAAVPEGFEIDKDATDNSPGGVGSMSASDAQMTPTAMMVKRKQGTPSPVTA